MRDADETVQKLLQSLRNAKPAANMEQRILTAMQDATDARGEAKTSRRWVSWPGSSRSGSSWLGSSRQALAMRVAGAAVLGLGLLLIVLSHPHPRTLLNVSYHPARAAAGRTPTTLEVAPKPRGHSGDVASPLNRVTIRARSRHSFAEDGIASSSYPPPPLPLTQQERLLVRLARRRDPGSLTILNAEVRGAQTARTTEQFQRFFRMNEQEMRTQFE